VSSHPVASVLRRRSTIAQRIRVSQSFLDHCMERYAGMSLSEKHTAQVIKWAGRTWVCVSGVSSGVRGNFEAHLYECVLEQEYKGPAYDPESHSYTGELFTSRGTAYIMTDRRITLIPDAKE